MPKQGTANEEALNLVGTHLVAALVVLPICFKIKARSVNNFIYLDVWTY